MLTRTFFFFFFLVILFVSCKEEEETTSYPDLRIYLDRFEEEARARGYDFDLSGVNAEYVDGDTLPDGGSFCGVSISNYQNTGERWIFISRSESCNWAGKTDLERENLFFHEIGHAFLNRPHEETKLCDGSPVTLMASTGSAFRVYQEGETDKRDYYISELIDRMAALDQCIEPLQDWKSDPVLYDFSRGDDDWVFYSDQDKYAGERVAATDQSFGDKLTIQSVPGSSTDNTGYWFTQFDNPNIPECAKVTFKVRMNAEQLNGPGAAIAVRLYERNLEKEGARTEQFMFLTTEDNPISGPLTDHVEELTIPCFTRNTVNMIVFVVMMPGTEGEVTFDDIELLVEEP